MYIKIVRDNLSKMRSNFVHYRATQREES